MRVITNHYFVTAIVKYRLGYLPFHVTDQFRDNVWIIATLLIRPSNDYPKRPDFSLNMRDQRRTLFSLWLTYCEVQKRIYTFCQSSQLAALETMHTWCMANLMIVA